MKQTKQTLQNRTDSLREAAASMAEEVSERIDVKELDFTEDVNKAFKAGCHVEIVLGNNKLQYDVTNGTKTELPITKRVKAMREKLRETIMSLPAQYLAQREIERQRMRAEDPQYLAQREIERQRMRAEDRESDYEMGVPCAYF